MESNKEVKGQKLRKKLQKGVGRQNSIASRFGLGSSSQTTSASTPNPSDTSSNASSTKPRLSLPGTRDIKKIKHGRLRSPPLPSDFDSPREPPPPVPKLPRIITGNFPPSPKRPILLSRSATDTSAAREKRRRAKTPFLSISRHDQDITPPPVSAPIRSLEGRTSSVDLIADQYGAVLGVRRRNNQPDKPPFPRRSEHTGGDSGGYEEDDETDGAEMLQYLPAKAFVPPAGRHSSEYVRHSEHQPGWGGEPKHLSTRESLIAQHSPRSGNDAAATISPTSTVISDDGTLVSCEEEPMYFKPVSFDSDSGPEGEVKLVVSTKPPELTDVPPFVGPPPTKPLPATPKTRSRSGSKPMLRPQQAGEQLVRGTRAQSSQDDVGDNLSLQICIDLLTRELSSAVSMAQRRSSSQQQGELSKGTAALQVWVMIEAYERLRERLLSGERHSEERSKQLDGVFNLWMRALYGVYDGLAKGEVVGGIPPE